MKKPKLTIKAAKKQLQLIREAAARKDFEAAHDLEDVLFRSALVAIADGETDYPQQLAETVLESRTIMFTRVCA